MIVTYDRLCCFLLKDMNLNYIDNIFIGHKTYCFVTSY